MPIPSHPPFTLTPRPLTLVAEIGKQIGRWRGLEFVAVSAASEGELDSPAARCNATTLLTLSFSTVTVQHSHEKHHFEN
jgi:hypothetical protein